MGTEWYIAFEYSVLLYKLSKNNLSMLFILAILHVNHVIHTNNLLIYVGNLLISHYVHYFAK